MKKIIIIVGALVVLLGGGGAGYFFFMAPDAEAAVGEEAIKDAHGDVASKDEHAGKKHVELDSHGKPVKGSISYIELDPLLFPIVDEYGVSQTISMVVALEVAGFNNQEHVKSMKPKLTDAYIQDMYGVLNEREALRSGVIQVGMIKARLNKITKSVMGDTPVNDVLLQVVNQRPI